MSGADAGLVLAGGRARRMGGVDKALVDFDGEPLGARVCRRFRPQVSALAVAGAMRPGFPAEVAWLDDGAFAGLGPLAGILAGLRWAAGRGAMNLATVPVDVPFLPPDLAERLATTDRLAFAAVAGRTHWAIGRWPVDLADALQAHLAGARDRSVRGFADVCGFGEVAFGPGDPFFNVNTPEDLDEARRRSGAAVR